MLSQKMLKHLLAVSMLVFAASCAASAGTGLLPPYFDRYHAVTPASIWDNGKQASIINTRNSSVKVKYELPVLRNDEMIGFIVVTRVTYYNIYGNFYSNEKSRRISGTDLVLVPIPNALPPRDSDPSKAKVLLYSDKPIETWLLIDRGMEYGVRNGDEVGVTINGSYVGHMRVDLAADKLAYGKLFRSAVLETSTLLDLTVDFKVPADKSLPTMIPSALSELQAPAVEKLKPLPMAKPLMAEKPIPATMAKPAPAKRKAVAAKSSKKKAKRKVVPRKKSGSTRCE